MVTAALHSLVQMWRAQALHMLASVAQRRPSPEVGARHGELPAEERLAGADKGVSERQDESGGGRCGNLLGALACIARHPTI